MAPRKKTSAMILARKSQQPENMVKTETEKMKSPLLEELPYSSNTVSNSQPTSKDHTLFKPDWSLLPEELLLLISEKLEDCFDVIPARSVCHSWRSIFPSCLLRESYSLPHYRRRSKRTSKGLCTLEKFPIFLLRVRPPPGVDELSAEFFVGGINQDKSEDHMELRSPFQCTVKVKILGSEQILLNVLDCQILPMGYQFRMVGWDPAPLKGVAFLPLDKERGKEFAVLLRYDGDFLVLRSSDLRWMRLDRISEANCKEIVTLRGKFYVNFCNNELFVIDPYSLEATPLMPLDLGPVMPTGILISANYLVPSGNDELFLVKRIQVWRSDGTHLTNLACRVCRLDENAGEWVVVTDLGDRILLIGPPGNSSCPAKELPDGCGASGNSFLFTCLHNSEYFYKYGVDTGNAEENLNLWRYSRETPVTVLHTSAMVALRVESSTP